MRVGTSEGAEVKSSTGRKLCINKAAEGKMSVGNCIIEQSAEAMILTEF